MVYKLTDFLYLYFKKIECQKDPLLLGRPLNQKRKHFIFLPMQGSFLYNIFSLTAHQRNDRIAIFSIFNAPTIRSLRFKWSVSDLLTNKLFKMIIDKKHYSCVVLL